MIGIGTLPQLSKDCETRVPMLGAKIEDFLSRWWNREVSSPAAVIVSTNENDMEAVISYAADAGGASEV
ncbi:hypothetical protein LTR91_009453 [Friedmanniomyces endolithicus]|uniref:Uncharacterized protein n=1 Tax=Friedmanniomyces endolithicus TaxID=329885 RepID=A0AAN6KLC3_9PEZI|nr:hypothetical protein LTS00_005480 [Friedmanniomyces endolithicus]KAK0308873.1 hypothetical protein LTR01_004753 [Friedmanniomyces endolithicus]KAK0325711.1 hypothetical protein LTR82_003248 [Friedmanniomyces endolithicus]KAK0829886.1 hypothetical protein LTR73_004023 [Friedmanniomyces endolithicus]KAK0926843.1 hypothetical protein LTR57_003886 [Friedmanniomyces endolithicus]